MPYYTRHASQKLKDKIDAASAAPSELVSLAEEIAIARVLAERAVRLFDVVVIDPPIDAETNKPKVFQPKQIALATASVSETLQHVASLVEKHARITALVQDKIPVGQVAYIATAMARIVAEEVGDEAVVRRIMGQFEQIKLPDPDTDPNVLLLGE